jgi:hypothetical protein
MRHDEASISTQCFSLHLVANAAQHKISPTIDPVQQNRYIRCILSVAILLQLQTAAAEPFFL